MKIRKIAYKLHLWVGLVTGLIVFIVCLTGCVWAFKLNGWIDGKVSVASVTKAHGFMRPSVAVARSSAAVGDIQPESVTYTPEGVVEVAFRDSSGVTSVSLDAAEGRILDVRHTPQHDIWSFIGEGHYSLWLPVSIGRPIVGYATLLFFLTLISGLVLWWPKNRRALRAALLPKWNAGTRLSRRLYDLHNVIGFYAAPPLIVIAMTGMVWAIDWWGDGIYALTSGGKSEVPWRLAQSDTTAVLSQKDGGGSSATFDITRADMLTDSLYRTMSSPRLMMVSLPDTADKTSALVVVAQRDRLVYYDADRMSFDRYTFKEITPEGAYHGRYADKGLADRLRRMNYDIHTGGIAGQGGRVIIFVASLFGMTIPWTGVALYINKRRKRNKHKDKTANKHITQHTP